MRPRTYLVLGGAAATLAVAIVGLDLAYSLVARVEAREADGSWRVLQEAPSATNGRAPYLPGSECGGPEMRLVVDNHKPIPDSPAVSIRYTNGTDPTVTVLRREEWNLGPFSVRVYPFTIPSSAFEAPSSVNLRGQKWQVHVFALVDDLQLTSACAREGA